MFEPSLKQPLKDKSVSTILTPIVSRPLEKSCFIPFMRAAKVHTVHQYDLISEIFFIALKNGTLFIFLVFLRKKCVVLRETKEMH